MCQAASRSLGQPYRGQCKYKGGGRCPNERTLKYTGDVHTLCETHRLRHNQIQIKSDTKMRYLKRVMAQQKQQQQPCATRDERRAKDVVRNKKRPRVDVDTAFLPEEIFMFVEMMGLHGDSHESRAPTTVVSMDVLDLLVV
ncbi:Aste57867_8165 [Aphanomyces stellatus]|uniref:Aste57867_8165 protein n=1 Tax=Aphanomyces stellatus TaxID=120398 RepID=A0A485KJI8_9STRA|nr:hypothetical protein As57867_008135 [Aphanomyces stellatus]VFT85053.1 Aste57867_8165 [Aphanomyces stellatus]